MGTDQSQTAPRSALGFGQKVCGWRARNRADTAADFAQRALMPRRQIARQEKARRNAARMTPARSARAVTITAKRRCAARWRSGVPIQRANPYPSAGTDQRIGERAQARFPPVNRRVRRPRRGRPRKGKAKNPANWPHKPRTQAWAAGPWAAQPPRIALPP